MPKIVSQPTAKDISMISPKIGEAKTANVNKQYFKNVVTMFFLFILQFQIQPLRQKPYLNAPTKT